MTKQQMKVIAQAEHEMFCLRDLLEGSVPAKVMNRAYEYVIKQDLLSVLRETPLTHQQLSVLAPQRRPRSSATSWGGAWWSFPSCGHQQARCCVT